MEDYVIEEVMPVNGAESLNDLLKELKTIQKDWGKLYGPILSSKKACLKASNLTKTPGANLKHVLLGLPLMMVADSGMSLT